MVDNSNGVPLAQKPLFSQTNRLQVLASRGAQIRLSHGSAVIFDDGFSCVRKCCPSEWCASGSRTRASSQKRVAQEDAVVPDDRAAAGTRNGAAQGGGCEGNGIKLLLVL